MEGFLIPVGAYGHNPNLSPLTYDTTKARALLAEAGYPEGFTINVITTEAWRLETQIINKMVGRIGLKVTFDPLPVPEYWRKTYIPYLHKPPEEQGWDMTLTHVVNIHGHTEASFLAWNTEGTGPRWNVYNPVYEEMWKNMARTLDKDAQEDKTRLMVQYRRDNAYSLEIYSPLKLYAVNKEVKTVDLFHFPLHECPV